MFFLKKLTFLCRNHLSVAAALPGAELFLSNQPFLEEATCPGQLRCLGQMFSEISMFFEEAICLGQLRYLGQDVFSEICLFGKKPLVPCNCAAWGRTFLRNQFVS